VGGQIGTIFKAGQVAFGLNYTTPEKINYKNVADLDWDGILDNLALESPHTVAAGIAFLPNNNVVLEFDTKWLNWSQADGYKDFDWEDQIVYAVGMQYKDPKGLSLRAGYNYGKSPVKQHDNFDAVATPTVNVQGFQVPTTGYEILRTLGFPAVQEQHVTAGIGYKFSKTFEMHLGYMHAFKNSIETSGTGVLPIIGATPISLKSEISADTFEFGLVWNYPRIVGW
jgi:long-chain fatty acid transport protein